MIGLMLGLADQLLASIARRETRKIFAFHDGKRRRWIDPLVVVRDLDRLGGKEWGSLFTVASVPLGDLFGKMPAEAQAIATREANDATAELAALVRNVFKVSPLDDTGCRPDGLTEAECLNLLAEFIAFLSNLAEEARPTVSLPLPFQESRPASSTTESSAGSTVTGTSSKSSEPKK